MALLAMRSENKNAKGQKVQANLRVKSGRLSQASEELSAG